MIVRARRKPIEEIPEKYLCCEEANRFFVATPEVITVDASQVRTIQHPRCASCGISKLPVKMLRAIEAPFDWALVDCYDLDEGVGDDH